MSALKFPIGQQFKSAGSATLPKPQLRIVSREPFSPIASFLLGFTSGLGTALGLILVIWH
jgi:hypothetical protein